MPIVVNSIVTFLLCFWFIMFMMSPMMFDAPGSENNTKQVAIMMLVLCYPVAIFLILGILGIHYFGFNSFKLAIISAVFIALAFSVFGYFRMLLNLQKGITNSGYSLVQDKAYFDGKFIEVADGESFTIPDNEDYYSSDHAWDKNHLFYRGKVIKDASVDGLRKKIINQEIYWVNTSQVIYQDNILSGANPDNFDAFEGYSNWIYSINDDQYLVFSYGKPLPEVDKITFTPLNSFIAKDKYQIFDRNKPILTEADAATFELLEDDAFGRDKNYLYYLNTKQPFAVTDIDVDSFEILDRGYLRDKNYIYLVHQYERIEKLENIDINTFEVTRYDEKTKSEAKDINHYYYDGKVVGNR